MPVHQKGVLCGAVKLLIYLVCMMHDNSKLRNMVFFGPFRMIGAGLPTVFFCPGLILMIIGQFFRWGSHYPI